MFDVPRQLYELDHLTQSAGRLRDQVRQGKIDSADPLSVLCASFLERVIEYARSVVRLVEVGEVASAVLITRTMLEGAACVSWVFKVDNPEARAVSWYVFVLNESLKAPDEDEQSKKATTNIYDLKREAHRLQEQGQSFKGSRWTVDERGKPQFPKDLIELLTNGEGPEAQSAYPFYQHSSAFTHWSPAAFPIDQEKQLASEWASIELPDHFVVGIVSAAHYSLNAVAVRVAAHFGIAAS